MEGLGEVAGAEDAGEGVADEDMVAGLDGAFEDDDLFGGEVEKVGEVEGQEVAAAGGGDGEGAAVVELGEPGLGIGWRVGAG